MIIYIALYGLAISGLVFNVNRSNRAKKIYLFVLFGLLILIAALRSRSVGTDLTSYYSTYYPRFANAKWSQITHVTIGERWEWGFCAFCKILAMINPNVQVFIVVTSIISIAPYAYFIWNNCEDVVFPTVFYIGMHIYTISFNIVRQSIAVGIILIALVQLKRRHIVRFILLVLLASQFHTMAIFMLVVLIFERLPFNRNVVIVLSVTSVLLAAFFTQIFNSLTNISFLREVYGIYTAGEGYARGAITIHTMGMFLVFVILFVFSFMESDGSKIPKRIRFYRGKISLKTIDLQKTGWPVSTLMYSSYLAIIFRFSAFFVNVLSRGCYYFVPLLMTAYTNSKNRNRTKDLIIYLAITLFFFYITIFRLQNLWGVVPYQFFWMGG